VTLTSAIKGQLTKASNANPNATPGLQLQARFNAIRKVFAKYMPREQAKHATRAYLVTHFA